MPPFVANERKENLVAFVSLKISGKPGMKISCSVKAEFAIPDGRRFNNDFFNIGEKHDSIALENIVALEQNTLAGNGDQ